MSALISPHFRTCLTIIIIACFEHVKSVGIPIIGLLECCRSVLIRLCDGNAYLTQQPRSRRNTHKRHLYSHCVGEMILIIKRSWSIQYGTRINMSCDF